MTAVDGRAVETRSRDERRNGKGERPVVPKAEFASYYGMPVLNGPVWQEREIAGYLFLGGLAGASSLLAAGAQLTGRTQLAERAKVVAVGAAGLGGAALVKDLGMPSRFVNMLRVFKPTSPMSVGSWLLATYGPIAGVAAGAAVLGRWSRAGALATAVAAALGPAVATYTGALIADTAVPAWHDAHRELPFVFAGSSLASAGGMGLVCAPLAQASPAQWFALIGAAAETGSMQVMERRMGMVSEVFHTGRAGRTLRLAQALTAGGAVVALVGRRHRAANVVAGVALTAASALTRFGLFEAGQQSAADPRYTVEPQRERLARGNNANG